MFAGVTFCEADAQAIANGKPSNTVDDPLYSRQWDLQGTNVPKVWAEGYVGDKDIKVCVIDSGVDYTHPDIVANLWANPGEVQGNQVDDDGNGMEPCHAQL